MFNQEEIVYWAGRDENGHIYLINNGWETYDSQMPECEDRVFMIPKGPRTIEGKIRKAKRVVKEILREEN